MIQYKILPCPSFEWIYFTCCNEPDFMMLHSASLANQARYSFIGFEPFARFVAQDNLYYWNDEILSIECPWQFIQSQCAAFSFEKHPDLPPFQGGAMGYFAYEFAHAHLNFPTVPDNIGLPTAVLYFFDKIIAYDHWTKTLYLIAQNTATLEALEGKLVHTRAFSPLPFWIEGEIKADFTSHDYQRAVENIRNHILAGDIFEANFTQSFYARLHPKANMRDLYWLLSLKNPAPFSALMQLPDRGWLLSASPERFIDYKNEMVSTEPIKGTCRRLKDPAEDILQKQQLYESEKDRAENIMIVDLMRNDLSKVCQPGSVEVTALCELRTFETVHHLVSVVKGKLEAQYDAIDLLKATFPAGSITGAPKLKAMEIIGQQEQRARGPYCGCLGYLSFTGEMDMAVTIRSYMVKDQSIYFSAGGAVVLDSNPAAEYQESLDKARRLKEVLCLTF